ncbi:MAG: hypothetical protein ABH827_03375 [bacterium]
MITRNLLVRNTLLISSILLTAPMLKSMKPFDRDNIEQNQIKIQIVSERQNLKKILDAIYGRFLSEKDIELNQGFSPYTEWEKSAINSHITYGWIGDFILYIFKHNHSGVESLLNHLKTKNIEQITIDRIDDLIFILSYCTKLNMPYPFISKSILTLSCYSLKHIEERLIIEKLLNDYIINLKKIRQTNITKFEHKKQD